MLLRRLCAPELVGASLESLARYKLRTSLATIGVVIGVAAVTTMVSVIEGARREVISQVELLGLRQRRVPPARVGRTRKSRGDNRVFADVERLRSSCLSRRLVAAHRDRDGGERSAANPSMRAFSGVTPDFQRMMRVAPAEGRLLASLDVQRDNRVCVLGSELSKSILRIRGGNRRNGPRGGRTVHGHRHPPETTESRDVGRNAVAAQSQYGGPDAGAAWQPLRAALLRG